MIVCSHSSIFSSTRGFVDPRRRSLVGCYSEVSDDSRRTPAFCASDFLFERSGLFINNFPIHVSTTTRTFKKLKIAPRASNHLFRCICTFQVMTSQRMQTTRVKVFWSWHRASFRWRWSFRTPRSELLQHSASQECVRTISTVALKPSSCAVHLLAFHLICFQRKSHLYVSF